MKYSIDTSAVLDGWHRYYPPDVFPFLWDKINGLIQDGALRAVEEVLIELSKKDDEVAAWGRELGLFVSIDDEIQVAVSEILRSFDRLVNTQRNRSIADPWVIALAQVRGCAVVTGEVASGNLDRPRIPDVCRALDVKCINLLQLFREEGWVLRA